MRISLNQSNETKKNSNCIQWISLLRVAQGPTASHRAVTHSVMYTLHGHGSQSESVYSLRDTSESSQWSHAVVDVVHWQTDSCPVIDWCCGRLLLGSQALMADTGSNTSMSVVCIFTIIRSLQVESWIGF